MVLLVALNWSGAELIPKKYDHMHSILHH